MCAFVLTQGHVRGWTSGALWPHFRGEQLHISFVRPYMDTYMDTYTYKQYPAGLLGLILEGRAYIHTCTHYMFRLCENPPPPLPGWAPVFLEADSLHVHHVCVLCCAPKHTVATTKFTMYVCMYACMYVCMHIFMCEPLLRLYLHVS
jgi:hypothetical protein